MAGNGLPRVVLVDEEKGGLGELVGGGGVVKQVEAAVGEEGGGVGDEDVFAVGPVEAFGADGGGDDGDLGGHGFVDFEAGAAADA